MYNAMHAHAMHLRLCFQWEEQHGHAHAWGSIAPPGGLGMCTHLCFASLSCPCPPHVPQLCDLAVHLPLERELCPFDLAPVTSTAIQMIFGDTVAIALMQVRI